MCFVGKVIIIVYLVLCNCDVVIDLCVMVDLCGVNVGLFVDGGFMVDYVEFG